MAAAILINQSKCFAEDFALLELIDRLKQGANDQRMLNISNRTLAVIRFIVVECGETFKLPILRRLESMLQNQTPSQDSWQLSTS